MDAFGFASLSIKQRKITAILVSGRVASNKYFGMWVEKIVFNQVISLAEFLNFWIILNEVLSSSW